MMPTSDVMRGAVIAGARCRQQAAAVKEERWQRDGGARRRECASASAKMPEREARARAIDLPVFTPFALSTEQHAGF